MYPSLMGYFNSFALISYVCATPVSIHKMGSKTFVNRVALFIILYTLDPWKLPSLSSSIEGQFHVGMVEPLSEIEVAYQAI